MGLIRCLAPRWDKRCYPTLQDRSSLAGLNEHVGNSIHDLFQGRVERRLDHGIYMLLSYTKPKTIEDASSNTHT